MAFGLLILRLVVGALFAAHGVQKLYGWLGGHGIEGTAEFFEGLGLRPGRTHAMLAGAAEFAGGTFLAFGLLTPFAALAITAVMVTAIASVHGSKGPWATDGGYEYNLVLIAVVFAITAIGPGGASLDQALGLHIAGAGWALAELVVGVAGGLGAVAIGRSARGERTGGPARPTAA